MAFQASFAGSSPPGTAALHRRPRRRPPFPGFSDFLERNLLNYPKSPLSYGLSHEERPKAK